MHVADASAKLGDSKTALGESRKALAVFSDLAHADPENDDLRQAVAATKTLVAEILIKAGNTGEAISLLTQSLRELERSYAASPNDEAAHFRIAGAQALLGKAQAELAAREKNPAQSLAHWREAHAWFEKSLAVYKPLVDSGKVSGEEAEQSGEIAAELAKAEAAIARLTTK
jgi:tetratricopeptide (TPR) repeat protein